MLAKEVFSGPCVFRPDGVFIATDMLTDGALVALEETGIEIGPDIKIVTHGTVGSPILFGLTRQMTVLEFDPLEVVRTLFALLDTLVDGRSPSADIVRLQPKLRDPDA